MPANAGLHITDSIERFDHLNAAALAAGGDVIDFVRGEARMCGKEEARGEVLEEQLVVLIPEKSRKLFVVLGFFMSPLFLTACETLQSEGLPVVPGHLVMERPMIPGQFKNDDGTTYTANLDAIVVRPDDGQAHPLAVINHGYDPTNSKIRLVDDFQYQTIEFARRGWVAVAFSRRGYGRSEGPFLEEFKGCNTAAALKGGVAPVEDMSEVIRLMSQKAYVDSAKIIAVGQSGGGYDVIALSASPPSGLVAVLNFAGGMASADYKKVACLNKSMVGAVARFGKKSRIPTLWVYTENDQVVPIDVAKKMYDAFTKAGGNARFVADIWFESDGHNLFFHPSGIPIWAPYVDAFLQENGLKWIDGLLPKTDMRVVENDVAN